MRIIRHYRGSDFINAVAKSPLSVSSIMKVFEQHQAATLVYEVTESGITAALSLCSDKDQFSRQIGRTVAIARLESNPATVEERFTDRFFSPHGIVSPLVNLTHLNPQLFSSLAFNAAIMKVFQK